MYLFATYIIHGKRSKWPPEFDIETCRLKLCVELYSYAKKKQDEGYDSESEYPGRSKKKEHKEDQASIILN